MTKKGKNESRQPTKRHSWAADDFWRKENLSTLLLDSLPHLAMIIRKDRTILAANRTARLVGAKVGGYCWHDFGSSEFIPEKDKKYIDEHNKIPPGDTRCYFCLADEGLKSQQPTHDPEVKAWAKIWDTYWIPLNSEVYFNYAIDVTERKQAEQKARELSEQLERQVAERTSKLTNTNEKLLEKMQQRERLEKQILEVSMAEQHQIGQSLHDSLGQALTGIAFTSKILEQKLAEKSLAEAHDAVEISKRIKQVLKQVRSLAKGLLTIRLDMGGIIGVLTEFASQIESIFGVTCVFRYEEPIVIGDNIVAIHIYHIAQEAVNNAIKHGQAKHISISLAANNDSNVVLEVKDDGVGLPENLDKNKGMGLHTMRYRAEIIGGSLSVRRDSAGGTVVQCSFRNNNIKIERDK